MDVVHSLFVVEITKQMAKACERVLHNHKEQYKRLRDYRGSHVWVAIVSRQGLTRFFGLFMCLKAQIDGFLSRCRPFIGVDGCFVKLSDGGHVLAATAKDANNNMFP